VVVPEVVRLKTEAHVLLDQFHLEDLQRKLLNQIFPASMAIVEVTPET
jgi:hypothetical protein